MSVLELREKRAGFINQARELVDRADAEKRDFSAEDEAQYEKLIGEADKLQAEIERREKLERMEVGIGEVEEPVRPETRTREQDTESRKAMVEMAGFRHWLNNGIKGMAADQMKVYQERALQADSDIYGGFLMAPMQWVSSLIKAVDNLVFIRQWANVMQVQGAADGLGAPSLDNDPADPTWTTEILIGSEDSTMSFGQRELKPNPLAKYIKVSRKLLRKVPSVEMLVRDRLAYKHSVVLENNYLNGNGVGQPLGVFTASNNGIGTGQDVSTGNTTTAMTFDGLKEAKYSLKGQYWPRARWLFHRDGVKMLAKLKDGDGQYIWQSSVAASEPDRLLNLPVFMSEYAPNTFTTGLYVGILGDWSQYWIADDLNMEIQRLDELYAATNQVGFISRYEGDGMPVLAEAFVRVKLA